MLSKENGEVENIFWSKLKSKTRYKKTQITLSSYFGKMVFPCDSTLWWSLFLRVKEEKKKKRRKKTPNNIICLGNNLLSNKVR